MINSYLKRQGGAATLLITTLMMVSITLIGLFAANYSMMQQKMTSSINRNQQAYQAAEAGLEFGVLYLNINSNTIVASPVSGFINYGSADTNITNITLANSSKFSVVYTNPTANNYLLIEITSTGTSDDGTSTRVLKQRIYGGISSLDSAVTTRGNLITSGNVTIAGDTNGVHTGGTFTQSGSNNITGILQNDSALAGLSTAALFSSYFGVTKAQMQSQSTFFANTSGLNYSSLTGKNWINSNVTMSGSFTIGTPTSPVLLVINGNLVSSGSITIYGIVYVAGTVVSSGSSNFNGGIVAEGNIVMSGSIGAHNTSIANTFTTHIFGKVPGTWRDF